MNKIILIDDNRENQRAIYGASYIDDGEFDSCLVHLERLNGDSDLSFLEDAACVMLHDSFEDSVDGVFIKGSRTSHDNVLDKVKGKSIPYVIFSDGHQIIGDWKPDNKNVVGNIKKSEFYRNLRIFLNYYNATGEIDLRLIAFGADKEKREIVSILSKLLESLDMYNGKDSVTEEMLADKRYIRFFELVKNIAVSSYDALLKMTAECKLTVANLKSRLNTLASRAIRYTGNSIKNKILAFGDERTKQRLEDLENVELDYLVSFQLGEKGEREMFQHISNNISADADAIVIDIDSSKNPDSALAYALGIRLSLHAIGRAALAPIIIMSSMTPDIFKRSKYSGLLNSKGVSFENPAYIKQAIQRIEPLAANDYCSGFLDFVKVKPNATEGRHSIANQWGADVLGRIMGEEPTEVAAVKNAKDSLYFRYILALSLDSGKILDILSGNESSLPENSIPTINASGCRVLLIDDEADKGWNDVLKKMFKGAQFECFNKRVADFEELPEQYRKGIENAVYDLILLDLRMNGVKEEESLNPEDFSGMKILKAIKNHNKGSQVIMLTASNKAWNMKALLDAGADGYYIKESPEYTFTLENSLSNASALAHQINRCIERRYLKTIWRQIRKIAVKLLEESESLERNVNAQLQIAFSLLEKATSKEDYAFAYVSLEQVIELITKEFIKEDRYGEFLIDETDEHCYNWVLKNGKCCKSDLRPEKNYPQWKMLASIYYQLLKGTDKQFGANVQTLIDMRNVFVHNDKKTLNRKGYRDIFNSSGYTRLFNVIYQLIELF